MPKSPLQRLSGIFICGHTLCITLWGVWTHPVDQSELTSKRINSLAVLAVSNWVGGTLIFSLLCGTIFLSPLMCGSSGDAFQLLHGRGLLWLGWRPVEVWTGTASVETPPSLQLRRNPTLFAASWKPHPLCLEIPAVVIPYENTWPISLLGWVGINLDQVITRSLRRVLLLPGNGHTWVLLCSLIPPLGGQEKFLSGH